MQRSIFNTKVTYLDSVCANGGREITLAFALINGKFRTLVEAIRNEPDEAKQKEMKKGLPCITASGLFGSPVDSKHLIEHSGFICIDIDWEPNKTVKDFHKLKDMIREIPFVTYCGRSVRGKGYLCLIPIKDPSKHSLYFKALQRDFKACGLTIDSSCCDVSRKRFVSYDPDPYINTGAKVYDFVIPEQEKYEKQFGRLTDTEARTKVEELICELKSTNTDIIQGDRQIWLEVFCALINQFGEEGRKYAHEISSLCSTYDYEVSDTEYTSLLRYDYGWTLGTLFYHANKVLKSAEHDFKDILVCGED